VEDAKDNRIEPANGEETAEKPAVPVTQPDGIAPPEVPAVATQVDSIGPAGAPESTELPAFPPKRSLLFRSIALLAAAIVAVLAWFVPGAGHLILRRWQRALVFFIAVGGLAVSGFLMRGNVFRLHSHDPFGTLGFLADASSGVFYLLSRVFERAGPNVSRALGDYGTRFIAAAGIVNILGVCDAYEIARGRRH
jgi:hypothetical protein